MIKVTKQFRAEISHRLLDHPGLCRNLHGHSYLFEITAGGEVKENGMVVDFKELKNAAESLLSTWDHSVMLESTDRALIQVCEQLRLRHIVTYGAPTAEYMAKSIADHINRSGLLGPCVKIVKVRVWETTTSYADWEA